MVGITTFPQLTALFLCTAPVGPVCRFAGGMWTVRKFPYVVHWSSPGFPRVVHPFVHRSCPQVLDNPCGQPVSCSCQAIACHAPIAAASTPAHSGVLRWLVRSRLLLDAVGELGDLRVDRAALGHQRAD